MDSKAEFQITLLTLTVSFFSLSQEGTVIMYAKLKSTIPASSDWLSPTMKKRNEHKLKTRSSY